MAESTLQTNVHKFYKLLRGEDPSHTGLSSNLDPSVAFLDSSNEIKYGRQGSRTLRSIESAFSELYGNQHNFLFSSGLSGLQSILSLLNPNSHVVIANASYSGNKNLILHSARTSGHRVSLVDQTDSETLRSAVRQNETELVWFETLSNPGLCSVDVCNVIEIAKNAGALVGFDSTLTPFAVRYLLDQGADFVGQSGSKYLSGHNDLLAGLVSLKDCQKLASSLSRNRELFGSVLSPFSVWLLARSLHTFHLRWQKSSLTAESLANWLMTKLPSNTVFYPGKGPEQSSSFEPLLMPCGNGAVISLALSAPFSLVKSGLENCQVFQTGSSFGSTISTVEIRESRKISTSLNSMNIVRFSIGVEPLEELENDLERLISHMAKS